MGVMGEPVPQKHKDTTTMKLVSERIRFIVDFVLAIIATIILAFIWYMKDEAERDEWADRYEYERHNRRV